LRLEIDARPVVLTGANGAGKTNLLEALSFLAPGRGLRRARLAEVGRFGADAAASWAVAAVLATPEGAAEIGTAHERPPGPVSADGEAREGKRVVQIDGKPSRGQAQLARLASIVWLTPEMDRLFVDGASARRRFLDRLVYGFDPEHARRVSTYEHAMRERARVLRAPGPPPDPSWLAALEDRMAREGVAIAVARRLLADRLSRAIALSEGPFPKAGLRATGVVETWLD
jgi:DNA replication and repair protein RecF